MIGKRSIFQAQGPFYGIEMISWIGLYVSIYPSPCEVVENVLLFNPRVKQVKEKGGIGIIAHPDEIRTDLPKYPAYPWTAWEAEEYDGIEIWNQMSEWMEKLTRFNQLKMLFSPRKALDSPTQRILSKWDQLNRKRKVFGIGAIDVHAHPYKLGPLKLTIFPYEVQFKSIRTHLILDEPLSPDLEKAKKQIYSAILNCNAFTANFKRGKAKGFLFYAEGRKNHAKRNGVR